MAKKVAKKSGGFAAKLGKKLMTAHEAHKNDETEFAGGGEMPAGVEHGIAKLVEAKIDVYKKGPNKGEYFFYAAGICVEPREIYCPLTKRNIQVEGLRTQLGPEPLCDTPDAKGKKKTFDDHYNWFLNEIRKLGVDTAEIDPDDLESTLEVLKDSEVYFKFRTWSSEPTKEFPNPRVNHTWSGVIEDYDPAASEEDEEVEEEETEEEEEETEEEEEVEEEETEETEEEETEEEEEEVDYTALGKSADKKNKAAIKTLTEAAIEAGYSEEEIEEFDSWSDLAEALASPAEEEEEEAEETEEEESEEEEETEEEWVPEKDETCLYRPIDPKTKKPQKKAIECLIIKVNKRGETVDLKCLATRKLYKAVAFSDLEQQ